MVYYPQVFFGVGSQVIYFDSHPEEQEGLLYSIYSHFKTALHGAWTGDVEKPLLPGSLRLVYFTVRWPGSVFLETIYNYSLDAAY